MGLKKRLSLGFSSKKRRAQQQQQQQSSSSKPSNNAESAKATGKVMANDTTLNVAGSPTPQSVASQQPSSALPSKLSNAVAKAAQSKKVVITKDSPSPTDDTREIVAEDVPETSSSAKSAPPPPRGEIMSPKSIPIVDDTQEVEEEDGGEEEEEEIEVEFHSDSNNNTIIVDIGYIGELAFSSDEEDDDSEEEKDVDTTDDSGYADFTRFLESDEKQKTLPLKENDDAAATAAVVKAEANDDYAVISDAKEETKHNTSMEHDSANIKAPRELTADETITLYELLKSQLNISGEDDNEDANNLVEYALDMIEGGENVAHVMEEVEFMEMSVCDGTVVERLRGVLIEYLNGLDDDELLDGENEERGEESEAEETRLMDPESELESEMIVSSAKKESLDQESENETEVLKGPTSQLPPPPQIQALRSPSTIASRSSTITSPSSSSSYVTPPTARPLPSRSYSTSTVPTSGGGDKSWISSQQELSVGNRMAAYQKAKECPAPSLREIKAAYAESSSISADAQHQKQKSLKKAVPAIKDRMKVYTPKKVNAVQDVMNKFEPPPDHNDDLQKMLFSEVGPTLETRKKAFEPPRENKLRDRLAKYESSPSLSSSYVTPRKVRSKKVNNTNIAEQQKMFSKFKKESPSIFSSSAVTVQRSTHVVVANVTTKPGGGGGGGRNLLKQRMANYQLNRKKFDNGNGIHRPTAPVVQSSFSTSSSSTNITNSSSRNDDEQQRPVQGEINFGKKSDLQKRMTAFANASSLDAFQKQNDEKKKTVFTGNRFVLQSRRDKLQRKVSKFEEKSNPDAFEKNEKADVVHGSSRSLIKSSAAVPPPSKPGPGGDLQKRLSTFKDVSAADAFQKRNLAGKEEGSSPKHMVGAPQTELQKIQKKVVGTPQTEIQKKMHAVEQSLTWSPAGGGGATSTPLWKDDDDGALLNPQEGSEAGYSGRVVENRVTVRDAPKDYEYLYDLCVKLERLKAQELENPRFGVILAVVEDGTVEGEGDTKEEDGGMSSLEGVIGGKTTTTYTANTDWINEDWINEHIVKDEKYDSIKFRFRDPMLFKQFDKTREKSRDDIIRTMVQKLLLHANDITQLELSHCLLPDAFLKILAEEVLKNPAESFPNLQLLNFESNLIQGLGIEVLSEVILNQSAWKYLQAILMENQKHSMTNEAERALAEAVSRSPSIVVFSASIQSPYKLKEINDTLLYNGDQLRLARRDHQTKEGTLKDRKRTEIELYFDSIAVNESDIEEVEIVGDQKFLTLNDAEKAKSGEAFATNTHVISVKMTHLGLQDDFAQMFGDAIANNTTIERVCIDSNSITGTGMKAIFAGLGQNSSIVEIQCRHQKKLMATLDEDALPNLLASNTSILKLGIDVRSKLVKLKLDRIVNANMDRARKRRASAKHQA